MAIKSSFTALLFSLLFFLPSAVWSNPVMVMDTCLANDDCTQAEVIAGVISDQPFVCVPGCNLYASPEIQNNACDIFYYPTVWYKVTLDENAAVMNLFVNTNEFDSPSLSLFRSQTGCSNIIPIGLTSTNLPCIIGSDGELEALGTPVVANATYYLAISSLNSIGGHFDVCINTLSNKSACVISRNVEIVSRSNAGPLEGPFDPAETVHICLNVNEFTALANGCQWFQGLVPVFGNGWDPASFDAKGQPLFATINGSSMGDSGNGLYGSATWDWFDDVGYHYDNTSLTVADLDGNGRTDICNSAYEMDCPFAGVAGGCCGPCWDENQGDILPAGWFAYGINGTCSEPSGPIRVDWGDGNTCGGGMGPWQFCFDLVTRDATDCMMDSTRRDLSLGFFTFADGEIGAWTGDQSVCALDHPTKLTLQAKCGRVAIMDDEELSDLCSGDTLIYPLVQDNIARWEWNISPFWAAPYIVNSGDNGFVIQAPLNNPTDEPVEIRGTVIGYVNDSPDIVIRKFKFQLKDNLACGIVGIESPKPTVSSKIRIYPLPAQESAVLEWSFDLNREAIINIYNVQGVLQKQMSVVPTNGHAQAMDLSDLAVGIYVVSFGNTDFQHVIKMVKW